MRGRIFKRKFINKAGELVESKAWTFIADVGRDADGKRKQIRRTVKGTKADCERELRSILSNVDNGSYIKPTIKTVGQYLNEWVNGYARNNTAPRTYERYKEIVDKNLIPALGSIPLTKLKPQHIQSYYDNALLEGRRDGKGGLSAQTVYHYHRILFKALRHAVKQNIIVRNVCESVEPPRPEYKPMNAADSNNVSVLLEAASGTPYYVLIFTAIFTGLRRSEILALKWQNVDLDLATMSITETLHHLKTGEYIFRQPKSKRGRRNIALSPALAILLRRHRTVQEALREQLGSKLETDDLVFSDIKDNPMRPNTVTRAFHILATKAGMPKLRFHDLRHTHASLMLSQGIHPKIVSERLGHSSINITLDTYSHVLPGIQEAAALRFEQGLNLSEIVRLSEDNACDHSVTIAGLQPTKRV